MPFGDLPAYASQRFKPIRASCAYPKVPRHQAAKPMPRISPSLWITFLATCEVMKHSSNATPMLRLHTCHEQTCIRTDVASLLSLPSEAPAPLTRPTRWASEPRGYRITYVLWNPTTDSSGSAALAAAIKSDSAAGPFCGRGQNPPKARLKCAEEGFGGLSGTGEGLGMHWDPIKLV